MLVSCQHLMISAIKKWLVGISKPRLWISNAKGTAAITNYTIVYINDTYGVTKRSKKIAFYF